MLIYNMFIVLFHCRIFHLLDKALSWLETWLVVSANLHRCLLQYVSCCFGSAMLYDETSK